MSQNNAGVDRLKGVAHARLSKCKPNSLEAAKAILEKSFGGTIRPDEREALFSYAEDWWSVKGSPSASQRLRQRTNTPVPKPPEADISLLDLKLAKLMQKQLDELSSRSNLQMSDVQPFLESVETLGGRDRAATVLKQLKLLTEESAEERLSLGSGSANNFFVEKKY